MRRDDSSPQAYRESVEGKLRATLERTRNLILDAAPDVDEGIKYGMLYYPGIGCLGAQKYYVSLYVHSTVLQEVRDSFTGLSCGKSCIRFTRPGQVDPGAVRRLVSALQSFSGEFSP